VSKVHRSASRLTNTAKPIKTSISVTQSPVNQGGMGVSTQPNKPTPDRTRP